MKQLARVYVQETKVRDDGWSVWHKLADGIICCDCGLAHQIESRVTPTGRINVRVKRNEEVTAEARRRRKQEPAAK